MQHPHTRRIVFTALLTALICVSTAVIVIPTPTSGYVHLGDSVLLFSALLLGPLYGALAAGIGSALADLLTGYLLYAPATLLIKALMGFLAGLLYRALPKPPLGQIVAGLAAELVMVGGYFAYAALIFGEGLSAAVSIPPNLMQGAFGIIGGTLLHLTLGKAPFIKRVSALSVQRAAESDPTRSK